MCIPFLTYLTDKPLFLQIRKNSSQVAPRRGYPLAERESVGHFYSLDLLSDA